MGIESFTNTVLKEVADTPTKNVQIYEGESLVIFQPTYTIDKKTDFSSYHFIIPPSNAYLPILRLDGKKSNVEENRIFSVNPGQILCCEEKKMVKSYIAMNVDRNFISEISRMMGSRAETYFTNCSTKYSYEFIEQIRLFMEEFHNKQSGFELILQSLSLQITVNLLRHTVNNLPLELRGHGYSEKNNINRAIQFIEMSYNDNISLKEVSQIANLSSYHFIRVFKAETGKTPYEYLMDVKIEKSKELLRNKKYNVTEIATLCGFASPSHFASVFKKKIGLSPSDYRKTLL